MRWKVRLQAWRDKADRVDDGIGLVIKVIRAGGRLDFGAFLHERHAGDDVRRALQLFQVFRSEI
jgi:hypothetical protein